MFQKLRGHLNLNKDIYEICFGIVFTLVLTIFSIKIAISANDIATNANRIADYQTQLSKQELSPYIFVDKIDDKLVLINEGGYIQHASIKLIYIVSVYAKEKTCYYPLAVGDTYYYTDVKDKPVEIPYLINLSRIDEDNVKELAQIKDKYRVKGFNYMIISYMDSSRQAHEEHYLIDEKDLVLYPVSEELDSLLKANADDEFDALRFPDEVTSVIASNIPGGASRSWGGEYDKIIELIKKSLAE